MKRKIGKKLGLSKETLRSLDDMNLRGVEGGAFTDRTNPCSVCPICLSENDTCQLETVPACCV